MSLSERDLMRIIYTNWAENNGESFQLRVPVMREELYQLTTNPLSIRQVRRLLRSLEDKGLITRHRCNQDKQLPGKLAQVTFYGIPNPCKAFQFTTYPIITFPRGPLVPVVIWNMIDKGQTPRDAVTFYWRVIAPPPQRIRPAGRG